MPILQRGNLSVLEMPRPDESTGLLSLPGVSYSESTGALEVERTKYLADATQAIFTLASGGAVRAAFRGIGENDKVTAADLKIINGGAHASVELTEDDVFVRQVYAANDVRIRRGFLFDASVLKKLATDYAEGRTLLLDHDPRERIGRTFAAKVEKKTVHGYDARWTVVRAYVLRDEKTRWAVRQMETGLLPYYSIGFMGGKWTADYNEETGIYTVKISDDAEAVPRLEAIELSAVYFGDTYGASDGRFSVAEGAETGEEVVHSDQAAPVPTGLSFPSTNAPMPNPAPTRLTLGALTLVLAGSDAAALDAQASQIQAAYDVLAAERDGANAKAQSLQTRLDALREPLVSKVLELEGKASGGTLSDPAQLTARRAALEALDDANLAFALERAEWKASKAEGGVASLRADATAGPLTGDPTNLAARIAP